MSLIESVRAYERTLEKVTTSYSFSIFSCCFYGFLSNLISNSHSIQSATLAQFKQIIVYFLLCTILLISPFDTKLTNSSLKDYLHTLSLIVSIRIHFGPFLLFWLQPFIYEYCVSVCYIYHKFCQTNRKHNHFSFFMQLFNRNLAHTNPNSVFKVAINVIKK